MRAHARERARGLLWWLLLWLAPPSKTPTTSGWSELVYQTLFCLCLSARGSTYQRRKTEGELSRHDGQPTTAREPNGRTCWRCRQRSRVRARSVAGGDGGDGGDGGTTNVTSPCMDMLRVGCWSVLFLCLVLHRGRERRSTRCYGVRPQEIVSFPRCPLLPAGSCRVSSRQGISGQAGLDGISKRGAFLGLSAVQANGTPHQHPGLTSARRPFTGGMVDTAIKLQSPSVAPNRSCPGLHSRPNSTT